MKQIFEGWDIELSLPRYVIGLACSSSCFIIIIIKWCSVEHTDIIGNLYIGIISNIVIVDN